MTIDIQVIIIALISLLSGILISWFIMKFKVQIIVEREKSKLASETILAHEKIKEQEQNFILYEKEKIGLELILCPLISIEKPSI